MSDDARIFFLKAANSQWETFMPELGVDVGTVRYLRREPDGGPRVGDAGIYRSKRTQGEPNPVTYELAETVYVVKGRVEIDVAGQKTELHAGDCMSFDKGTTASWNILTDDYEEFFVYS